MRYCHLAGAVLLFSAGGSFAQLPQAPSENAPIANTSTTAAGPQSSPAGFTGSTQKFADLNFRCPPLPSEMLCAENGFAGDHHTEHQPEGFHWGRALAESFTFLAIEQAYVVHTDFRWVVSENGIPFNHYWRDYKQSLSAWVHSGWSDGDPNLFGYVGHPIQGALSSYIEIQNDPKSATLEFSNTRRYWRSRLKATIWNAVYSTQWNLGPISEVTVEKYGAKIRPPWNQNGSWPCTTGRCYTGVGQIDIVMTPLGGLGWLVGEDWMDKNIARRVERGTRNRFLIDTVRCTFNPIRAGANILHGNAPWFRARDAGGWLTSSHP